MVIQPVLTFFSGLWEAVKTAASSAWSSIQGIWSAVSGWFSGSVIEPVRTAWSTGMESVRTLAASAWEGVRSAWQGASSWFESHVTGPITSGVKGFANSALGFFEGLANGAIRGVNSIIPALNKLSFSIPDWVPVIGGNHWGFRLPTVSSVSLPRLAKGAVLEGNDPYLAVVNDQKHGTNVETPLSTMVEAMMMALRQSDFGGGDINVSVKAVFEGQLAALARCLYPYFEAESVRTGTRASGTRGMTVWRT